MQDYWPSCGYRLLTVGGEGTGTDVLARAAAAQSPPESSGCWQPSWRRKSCLLGEAVPRMTQPRLLASWMAASPTPPLKATGQPLCFASHRP